MKPLNELFEVAYGNKLDLNKLTPVPPKEGGVNFVGRSSQNHGVSGVVARLADVTPYEAGLITVALGGSKLLSSFVQEAPFYTAQNVAVLRPLSAMTFQQKLFICLAIRHNRFRYSAFGREANRTLRTLLVPEAKEIPNWVSDFEKVSATAFEASATNKSVPNLDPKKWKPFALGSLFDIKKGKRLTKAEMLSGETPFVGSSDSNNGITATVGQKPIHDGNTISVAYDGSVGEAFYQPKPFWALDSVNVLYPKFPMTVVTGLFLATLIRKEQYRFSYGRKWHMDRMNAAIIYLPVTPTGKPDFHFMDGYMKSLPYSSQLLLS
jgi:hypothetical protein